MSALVEARSLPDWPGVTGYQITSNSPADVQAAITAIMHRVGELGGQAAFENPQRSYSIQDGFKCWRSHGYVREAENPTRAAMADVRAYQRSRLSVVR